jgi:threonine aldolase
MIDLRSDTVTKPTPAMRKAMAEAEVGDDVYQEDPTVNRLEKRAAEISGKEAALFLPTGTMGNTIAIKLHTEHGQEVICESRGHLLDWELSMVAWFSGCLIRPVHSNDGVLRWESIAPHIRNFGPHNAPTACIELENTHNLAGGTVYPQEVLDDVCDRAHERGLKIHLDGARVFNASAASGLPVDRIVERTDTVQFCLSKGLGAPVGSMLCGPSQEMDRARLYRKRLGGGMRQAGVLAAAGLVALEEMPQRLHEDHANASLLAEGFRTLGLDPGRVETNIVVVDLGERIASKSFVEALSQRGIRVNAFGPTRVRFVTHFDISRQDCEAAVEAVAEILR